MSGIIFSIVSRWSRSRVTSLETMEKIMPDIDKFILDGDVGQRLLPLMPLGASPLLPAALRPATDAVKGT